MRKSLFLLIVISLFLNLVNAQEYQEILKDIFLDAEFFLMEEEYVDAVLEYDKLYKRGYKDNANINYRMGVCYLNIPGEKEKSVPYLEKAVQNVTERYKEGIFSERQAPIDAWLYLGNAYRVVNDLPKARDAYNKYLELLDDPDSEMAQYTNQELEACKLADEAFENPVFHLKKNLGEIINGSYSDFNPVVTYDESTMVYMTGLKFYDALKYTKKENGEWTEPLNITPDIQSDGDQYANSLSPDGMELYLNKMDNFNSDIYYSQFQNGKWIKSVPLNKNINTKYWESHASISPDGEYLYFASNRKGGHGGMDIYMSTIDEETGDWGPPANVGTGINTELNEDHPFMSEDGKVLYFSSQGHQSIGGFDIFYSEKLPDGTWTQPKNLGYPINTTDDDLFFVPVGNGKYGYQSIFDEGSYGSQDIYRFSMFETEAEYQAALGEVTPEPEVEPEAEPEVEPEAEPEVEPEPETEPETELVTEPEPEPEIVVIRAIFFGFDKYNLTAQARTKLDALVGVMKTYPELVVLVTGHTDSKGPDSYNLALSKRRANSAVTYLKDKGAKAEQLEIKGAGENDPVAINSLSNGSDSPDGRKLNRRVVFKILRPDLPHIKIEPIPVPEALKIK